MSLEAACVKEPEAVYVKMEPGVECEETELGVVCMTIEPEICIKTEPGVVCQKTELGECVKTEPLEYVEIELEVEFEKPDGVEDVKGEPEWSDEWGKSDADMLGPKAPLPVAAVAASTRLSWGMVMSTSTSVAPKYARTQPSSLFIYVNFMSPSHAAHYTAGSGGGVPRRPHACRPRRPTSTRWCRALGREELGGAGAVALDGCAGRPVSALAKEQHTGVKSHTCEECNKRCASNGDLVKHKRVHTGEKPFSCDECHKRFTTKGSLDVHKRIHTGEKPYRCIECNKGFTYKSDLTTHTRIHTGEKPYSCKECTKKFRRKIELNSHERIHTGAKPYGCEVCKKHFRLKSNLDMHKRIHTGEKPYRCEECNKQFTQKVTLDIHKRIHTGEKPYGCEVCHKRFSDNSKLYRHKKSHIDCGAKPV